MCGPKARTPNHGTAARSIAISGGSVNSQATGIGLFAPQITELAAFTQLQQEGAHRRRALVWRVEPGVQMPGWGALMR